MPDLNSLPPSPAPAGSQVRPNGGGPEGPQRTPSSSSPRSTSVSLAAAASINAGIQHQDSRRSSTSSNRNRTSQAPGRNELSRSNVPTNLNLYDPTLPAPGELQTGDLSGSTSQPRRSTSPYRLVSPTFPFQNSRRAPSLGELHQELEQEQEAQVNRLLEMIRQQQAQLEYLQRYAGYTPSSTAAVEDSTQATPISERSPTFPSVSGSQPFPHTNPRPHSPVQRGSTELSRQASRRSRAPSQATSPALRPQSAGLGSQGEEWWHSGTARSARDEAAYYEAETQNLTRENQMLRLRIRQLEQQLSEASPSSTTSRSHTSNLTSAPMEAHIAPNTLEVSADDADDKD